MLTFLCVRCLACDCADVRVVTCEFVCVPAHSEKSVCMYGYPFCIRTYVRACACLCLHVGEFPFMLMSGMFPA